LTVFNPGVAVISVGEDNSFGYLATKIIDRLEEKNGENIYRDDEQGTVKFITDGKKLWVKTEK
jgi:beta-lactamase superfamily II metal-dependent hydrolase